MNKIEAINNCKNKYACVDVKTNAAIPCYQMYDCNNCSKKRGNKEWEKLEHWRLFELYKKAHPGDFQHLTKDDQHYSREELFKIAFTLGCAVREKAEHVENLTYKTFEWLM